MTTTSVTGRGVLLTVDGAVLGAINDIAMPTTAQTVDGTTFCGGWVDNRMRETIESATFTAASLAPETFGGYGKRNGGRKMAVGRYKGSRWAKRATRRGGNPAAHG